MTMCLRVLIPLAEVNQTATNHLREWLEIDKQLSLTCSSEFCLVDFPETFYSLKRQKAKASTQGCSNSIDLRVHLIQSDDVDESLRDANWTPSFEWEETVAIRTSKGLKIYHKGRFTIRQFSY